MADKWLTVTEAAKISGYHPYYLRALVRKGRVKAKRFGPLWQVSQLSLIKYLQSAEHSEDHRRGPRLG